MKQELNASREAEAKAETKIKHLEAAVASATAAIAAAEATSKHLEANGPVEKNEKYISLLEENGRLQNNYERLHIELEQQQIVTEQVRQEASSFLEEMRTLAESQDSGFNTEKYVREIEELKKEVIEWKQRYSNVKAKLRSLKTTSYSNAPAGFPHVKTVPFLNGENDMASVTDKALGAVDSKFLSEDGKILDTNVIKFQVAMDDFLVKIRTSNFKHVMDHLHSVVAATRVITNDVSTNFMTEKQFDNENVQQQQQDKAIKESDMMQSEIAQATSFVSTTATHLITTARNHSTSGGLSPLFLIDAAATDLSQSVVDLIKLAKMKPTYGMNSPISTHSHDSRGINGVNDYDGDIVSPNPSEYQSSNGSLTYKSQNRSRHSSGSHHHHHHHSSSASSHRHSQKPSDSRSRPQSISQQSPQLGHQNRASSSQIAVAEAVGIVGSSGFQQANRIPAAQQDSRSVSGSLPEPLRQVPGASETRSASGPIQNVATPIETNDINDGMLSRSPPSPSTFRSQHAEFQGQTSNTNGNRYSQGSQNDPVGHTRTTPSGSVDYAIDMPQVSPIKVNTAKQPSSPQPQPQSHQYSQNSQSPHHEQSPASLPPLPTTTPLVPAPHPSKSLAYSNSNTSTVMIDPEKRTVKELQEYLETQTVAVIESIQALLTGIRGKATYHEVRHSIFTTTYCVHPVIDATSRSMTQTRNWRLKDLGQYIVESLNSCCERMQALYDDSESLDENGGVPDRQFKQRLAGIAFDTARCTKELVKAVEEVSLDIEISEIDKKLETNKV